MLAGEGVATRKYDGTCMMLDGAGRWWARREVKGGKEPPPNYQAISTDENTGKTVGWEPVEQSPFVKFYDEARFNPESMFEGSGTYELCGPKINGNPEGYESHVLIPHAEAARLELDADDLTFERLAEVMAAADPHFEGIVWHHPDGRMAKLKVRDFPSA